jgi:metal-responsive CopG/Arc/MetJ family transcriptional regulator
MKVKTSINVERDLLETVDKLLGKNKNRSAFIEAAIQSYIVKQTHAEGNARDLEMINESADILNQEALDVLDYQVAV